MKFKYTGDLDEVTIRDTTFPKAKPVDVDDPALIEKLQGIPFFAEVKSRGKKQD